MTPPSSSPMNSRRGCGSLALHSRCGAKAASRGKSWVCSQSLPGSVRSHFSAQGSPPVLITICSSVNSLQASEASRPVQVSRLALRYRSLPAGRGGWSAAKISPRCSLHQLEGLVPEMAQMTSSTMPAGRAKGVGLPPLTYGTAACMNCDQMGAAPLRPLVLSMGV